jgi:ssDNA-binding Zn-finger/Zn-ribbon topoisomerase 1
MSDNPNKLKAILLEDVSTEQRKEFAGILAEACGIHDLQAKGHRCWFQIPTIKEYENMKEYENKKCPKCGKGRVVVEQFRGNFGDNWFLKCYWGEKGCDFQEYISDDDNI